MASYYSKLTLSHILKKIRRIKGAGIFNDYNADKHFNEFSVFNLVYGWNGSGKTTLSRLLSCLETKLPSPSFPNAEFEILLDDGSILKQSSLSSYISKVLVFNQAFVEENIDWRKQGDKSIVVVAEDNIDKRKRYFELKDKLIPVAKVNAEASQIISDASVKEKEDFLTSLARSIKQSLQLIDTSDKKYLNYDKTKLRAFIDSNEVSLADKSSILNTADLEQLRQKVRTVQKPEINNSFKDISVLKLDEGKKRINILLRTSVLSKIIQRLQDDSRLNEWVG
jgi:wobble nucleotide-excising tRNase